MWVGRVVRCFLSCVCYACMCQLEEECKVSGSYIAGIYYANELAHDTTALPAWSLKLANKICEHNPSAVVLQVRPTPPPRHHHSIDQLILSLTPYSPLAHSLIRVCCCSHATDSQFSARHSLITTAGSSLPTTALHCTRFLFDICRNCVWYEFVSNHYLM